jgi:predicted MPP superfamily phosphohydrolase
MITRRGLLRGAAATLIGGVGLTGYAFGIEPHLRLRVARYRVQPKAWPTGLRLRIAVVADVHACEPWMGARRIQAIVTETNRLDTDVVLLLGDYVVGHRWVTDRVHSHVWARQLARLRAPLGVHAVLGNHDWWEDRTAQRRGGGPTFARLALEAAGIRVYENDAFRLVKDGQPFWLAGLGDQLALLPGGRWGRARFAGVDDLPATLAKVTDEAPVVLMAHEPDIFPQVPERVALTLSGHTHGGQLRFFGYSPIVPSRYGNRYAYGHIVESNSPPAQVMQSNRHLIVSGGLGCSIVPLRLGVPPEVVLVDVGA